MPTRAAKRAPADVYQPLCPSRGVLDHVTTRWAVLVLIALKGEMHRFSALRRKVGGVSEKMLAQTLATLEEDGFVQRTAYAEVPPRVEYRLTALGAEVAEHVEQLVRWIESSLPQVMKARASYQPRRSKEAGAPSMTRTPRLGLDRERPARRHG